MGATIATLIATNRTTYMMPASRNAKRRVASFNIQNSTEKTEANGNNVHHGKPANPA